MNFSSVPSVDFYISVIDNYGDMGFAANLALSLHDLYPNLIIRFFSDNEPLFHIFFGKNIPEWVEYIPLATLKHEKSVAPSKLICSFFDYPVPKEYLARFPYEKTIVIFSYFLLHRGLESLHKTTYILEGGFDRVIHFVPSLLPLGGGIIINREIERKMRMFQEGGKKEKWISVFVYRETLEKILPIIERDVSGTIFWICGDTSGVRETLNTRFLPFMSLEEYGVFQGQCDANVVRGENSLCQGLLSGKPVLWDIYKESNDAHVEKIEDYLSFLKRQFPETDWNEYARIIRQFNGSGEREQAFLDFIGGYHKYKEVFGKMREYIKKECDLIRKLEEILET